MGGLPPQGPAGWLSCQSRPSPGLSEQAPPGPAAEGTGLSLSAWEGRCRGPATVVMCSLAMGSRGHCLPTPLYILCPCRTQPPRERSAHRCWRAQPSPESQALPTCSCPSESFWKLCSPRSHERCALFMSHPQMIFLNKRKETPALTCVFLPVRAGRTLATLSPGTVLPVAVPSHIRGGPRTPAYVWSHCLQKIPTLEASTVHGGPWGGLRPSL